MERRRVQHTSLALVASFVIVLTACGSGGSDPGESGMSESAPPVSEATATPDTENGDEGTAGGEDGGSAGDDGTYTAEDSGSGLVRLDGVEYPNFVGDCFVHRGLGDDLLPVEVGDLATPGLTVVVGVDNVASEPDQEANFVMLNGESFRMAGLGGNGTIDSIEYVGPRASFGSVELALVAFSGTTDDGLPVVAELVCEIGLG